MKKIVTSWVVALFSGVFILSVASAQASPQTTTLSIDKALGHASSASLVEKTQIRVRRGRVRGFRRGGVRRVLPRRVLPRRLVWGRGWRRRSWRGSRWYWYGGRRGWYWAGVGALTLAALRASPYYARGCDPVRVKVRKRCWPNSAGRVICTKRKRTKRVWRCR